MKSVDKSCQQEPLDGFFSVEISDLVAAALVGGAVAGVTADASAYGTSSLAATNTKTYASQFAGGGSIAYGWGSAIASGNNPTTNVSVFGEGNLVWEVTTNYTTKNKSVSTGFVLAATTP